MTTRTSKTARKFAKATFELLAPQEIEQVNTELAAAATIFQPKTELLLALIDPRYALAERLSVTEQILEKLNVKNQKTINLIKTLAEARKLHEVPAIAEYFYALVQALKKSLHIEVLSAYQVQPTEIEALKAAVTKQYAGLASVSTDIDTSLIGGMQIKIGDKVFDSSVRGALEKVAASFIAG
jgi:F-type H+-transporting ATPase subunit delta